MGLWGEVAALATRKELNECQSRLQALLADRAAGKRVDELEIRSENNRIGAAQRWLVEHDRQAQKRRLKDEAEIERNREARMRARAMEDERNRQLIEEYQQQLAQASAEREGQRAAMVEELAGAVDGMVQALDQVGEGVAPEDEEAAAGLLLAAISGIRPEDAQRLGPSFGAAWRWIKEGEDPDRQFADDALIDELDADAFDSDEEFRCEAARRKAVRLLDDVLQPWSEQERDTLALRFAEPPGGLPGKRSAPMRIGDGHVFAEESTRKQRIVFHRLDAESWTARPWFALPLPAASRGADTLDHARGGEAFCLDQSGTAVYSGDTLYLLPRNGAPEKLARFGLADLDALAPGYRHVPVKRKYHEHGCVQLVTLPDGSPLLLMHVRAIARSAGGECPPGGQPFEGVIAVDPLARSEAWRVATGSAPGEGSFGGIPGAVENWLYHPGRMTFIHFTWRPRPIRLAPVYPAQRKPLFGRLFGGAAADAAQLAETRSEALVLHVDEREAVTGNCLRSLDLYGSVPGFLHDASAHLVFDEENGIATVVETRHSNGQAFGILDLDSFSFDPNRALPRRAQSAEGLLGPNRLHTLRQMYRHFGDGSDGLCATRLAGRGPQATRERIRPIGAGPGFLYTAGWEEQAIPAEQAKRWVSHGRGYPGGHLLEVVLCRDGADWAKLEDYATYVTESVLKTAPQWLPCPLTRVDLHGVPALRRTIGHDVVTMFAANGQYYRFVVHCETDPANVQDAVRDVDRYLTRLF